MNNHQQISSEASILSQAIAIAQQSLSAFFDNLSDGSVAFGNNYDQNLAQELFQAFAQGNFTAVPSIKILSEEVLGATNGAYTKQKNEIYLNEKFLRENADNLIAIADVIIEEIGHFIDAQINAIDSDGDEGDIFARLVNGENLSAETLANLKAEDDSKTIVLGGEVVEIEQNNLFGTYDRDNLTGGSGNDIIWGDPTVALTIYQHGNYGGSAAAFGGVGNYDIDRLGIGNDQLSSLRVSKGIKVTLYEHGGFTGASRTYYSDTSSVGDFNDKTSSIRTEYISDSNDYLDGRAGDDLLKGERGNDTLIGGTGNDDLGGGEGDDQLYGGSGNDTLYGGNGNDLLDGDEGPAVTGSARDIIYASSGNDTLYGGEDNDTLYGETGNDALHGEDGDDQLYGGSGNDTLYAGNGNDLLDGDEVPAVTGSAKDIIYASSGNDTLYGGEDNDTLYGETGNDALHGEDGDDQLYGGSGLDTLYGGNGNDTLNLSDRTEGHEVRLNGSNKGSSYSLNSNGGRWNLEEDLYSIENVIGTNFNDKLYGDGNANQLQGNAGDDTLSGGDGLDTIHGGSGIDTFDLSDRLQGYEVRLDGNNEGFSYSLNLNGSRKNLEEKLYSIENVIGSNFNDKLYGDGNANWLQGSAGNDSLEGLAGNDTLDGGLGSNYLEGGQGNDVFVVRSGGTQIIQDFERNIDKLDITQSGLPQVTLAPNNGTTKLINNGQELATIQNRTLSTQDLILITQSEQQSLFPTLNVSEKNITGLIKAWADRFAQSRNSTINGNIDMSRVRFQLTQMNVTPPPEIPSSATKVSNIWRNLTANEGTLSVALNNEKTLGTTITTENQTSVSTTTGVSTNFVFSVSNTVKASAGVEIKLFNANVENSTTIEATFGVTANYERTFGETLTRSRSDNESSTQGTQINTNIPVSPQTVLYHDILTYQGTHNAPITLNYSVGGEFRFTLNNGQSFAVPINAILQHYDLQDGRLDTFNPEQTANLLGNDFDGNGTSLYYADQLNFTLIGSLKLDATFSQTTTNSVTDVLLNGSLANGYVTPGLEIIRDSFGAPTQVRYTANVASERLWIVKDSLTSNMMYDSIFGFTPGNDKIGIAYRTNNGIIDGIEDLNISYSQGNADINYGNHHLARLHGVDPNSLSSSDFVFSTQGTIFDPSVRTI